MSKLKTVRDGAVVALALATAYGMGIISCVYWELKALAELSKEGKKESDRDEKIHYQPYHKGRIREET